MSPAQLNGAQGQIYLTITFAVLIFMIKTIRHWWVACARALRLTMIVKWAAFYDVCVIHLEMSSWCAWWISKRLWHRVCHWKLLFQRHRGLFSLSSFTLFYLLFWASLHLSGWTALCSSCLKVRCKPWVEESQVCLTLSLFLIPFFISFVYNWRFIVASSVE